MKASGPARAQTGRRRRAIRRPARPLEGGHMTTGPTSRAATAAGSGTVGDRRPGVCRRALAAARRGLVAVGRGLALALPKVVLAFIMLTAISLIMTAGIWIVLLPFVAAAVRGLANLNRRLAGNWSGVDIP